MAGSTKPGPTRQASRRRGRQFTKTRWLYQKDGRDLGPFKPPEVKELLRSGEVGPDTRVRESAHKDWHPVREVRVFVEYIKEIQEEREQAAHERELDKAEGRVRSARKLPIMLIVLCSTTVAAAAGWYGYQRWIGQDTLTSSNVSSLLLESLELQELRAKAYLNTEAAVDWVSEHVAQREIKPEPRARRTNTPRRSNGTPSSNDAAGPAVPTANDLQPTIGGTGPTISFDGSDGASGRVLTVADVQSVRQRAVPKLIACAQREADRVANFPGTTVQLSVMPSGRIGSVQIGQNGKRSRAFVGCVNGALRRIKIEPFDPLGSAVQRTITVPLKVGR